VSSLPIEPSEIVVTRPAPVDPDGRSQMVWMKDGVGLATDVYLPPGEEGPFPVVLTRLPYDKSGRLAYKPLVARYLTKRGFAVVAQDVRGKFRSQGECDPFVNEVRDGYDTLDWIVAQEWSSGKVGMIGGSYIGFTQWAAAASGHPALAAIVPKVTGSWFASHFASQEEPPKLSFYEWFFLAWSGPDLYEQRDLIRDPRLAGEPRVSEWFEPAVPRLRDFVSASRSGAILAHVYPDGSPAERIAIPALHLGGWWDNVQRWQLDDWLAVQSAPAAEHQFLRMRAHDHDSFDLDEVGIRGIDYSTDDDALEHSLPRLLDETVSFLDHYLRDGSGVWDRPRVEVEEVGGGVRTHSEWPPSSAEPTVLYLTDPELAVRSAEGGGLSSEVAEVDGVARWIHDPANPVPFVQESDWGPLLEMTDEASVHSRPDVATFTGVPPSSTLAGPVVAHLVIDSAAPSTHVVARLHDVYPDGRCRYLLSHAAITDTSRGPTEVSIRLGDIAYRLPDGHRLRLAISTSCAGLYFVHPGNDEDIWASENPRSAEQRLLIGRGGPRLELHLLP
jgi:predicted acyl esterase